MKIFHLNFKVGDETFELAESGGKALNVLHGIVVASIQDFVKLV